MGKRAAFLVLAVLFFLPTLMPSSWARSLTSEYLLLLLDAQVVDIWLEPGKIPEGGASNLHWYVSEGASASIDQGIGSVSGQGLTVVAPQETTTYTLSATLGGGTYIDSATLVVANPFIDVQPQMIYRGQSATLSWDATDADSASIEPLLGDVELVGSTQVSPQETTTYEITALVDGQPAIDETTLIVDEPTAYIMVSPETIDYGECAVLSWAVTGSETARILPGIGEVATSSSLEVCPAETTTYEISAQTTAGLKTDEQTLIVTCSDPEASLWSSAELIWPGQNVLLTWDTSKADSVWFDPDLGTVALSDSMSVTPSGTTNYVLTAARDCGSQATASVEVRWPNIKASPSVIARGQKTTLIWEASDDVSVSIEPDVGSVGSIGSTEIQPLEDTTYTMTVNGANGQYQTTCLVSVSQPDPSVSLAASPRVVIAGESTTLTWTSERIEEGMSLNPSVGAVAHNGSLFVTPQATTTFELTGSGHGTTAVSRVTVIVRPASSVASSANFIEHYADLVPAGLELSDYDQQRFAVATGQVVDQQGVPIAGVSVSVLDHPEWGSVLTDEDGVYSLPVEGGETLTLVLRKDDFLETQRQVSPAWQDVAVAPTMSLVPNAVGAAGMDLVPQVRTLVSASGKAPQAMVHCGPRISDESGSRRCTVVFPPSLRAFSADMQGCAMDALPAVEVSSTEYVTPESMPAALPPTSAFTYCVELTAGGEEHVTFSEPAVVWVDNFLGFPVGSAVPVGTYAQDRGVWVPEDNGLVVALLDLDGNGVVDALDADGDGQPDDLDGDGLFDDEVLGLEDPGQYQPGEEYWRVTTTHFSSCDYNWPFGPPPGSGPPDNPPPDSDSDDDDDPCKNKTGSEVHHRSRAFHDDIPIPGTDLTLHYASDRTPGYKRIITIPASGATLPEFVKRIVVKAEVAGRVFEQTLDPLPNQTARFVWDGLDWLGRPSPSTTAKVSIGFVYNGYYYASRAETTQSFGQLGETPTFVFARQELTLWQRHDMPLTSWSGGTALAQGWTVSSNHFLDRSATPVLHTGAGGTVRQDIDVARVKANVSVPRGMCRDEQGNLYYVDGSSYHRLNKIAPDGTVSGLLQSPELSNPRDVVRDGSGNFYISNFDSNRIVKAAPDGTVISSQYGIFPELPTGWLPPKPRGLTLDSWGNLYVTDYNNGVVWKLDPDGRATHIAGKAGTGSAPVDGMPALEQNLYNPSGIAVDSAGTLYVALTGSDRVVKIATDGTSTIFAGTGSIGYNGDGIPATQAKIWDPYRVAVDSHGNVYITEYMGHRVRRVGSDGIRHTVAGTGDYHFTGDGLPALTTGMNSPYGLIVNPDGSLDVSDAWRIWSIGRSLSFPGLTAEGEVGVADGGELHVFNMDGRHLRTLDAASGQPLRFFDYDEDDRLTAITDRFGRAVTIDWQNPAAPTIVSPDGLTTTLAIDGEDRLTSISYPGGEVTGFEYDNAGLLTVKIDPRGKRFGHIFDADGRLIEATNEAGGDWRYASSLDPDGKTRTTVTTGENEVTTYLDASTATTQSSVIVSPSGATTTWSKDRDSGAVHKELSCGKVLDFEYAADPIFRSEYVSKRTETVPSGLSLTTTFERTSADTNADGRPDRFTITTTEAGQESIRVEDVLAGSITETSAAGRVRLTQYDPVTLLAAETAAPGLEPVRMTYDAAGRMIRQETGSGADLRAVSYGYDAQGNLHTVTDPLERTTTLDHDANGRVTAITRPGGSTIGFDYDGNGNTTLLTTPRPVDNGFGYDAANNRTGWTPPEGDPTAYTFDKDNRLTRITRPSGTQVDYVYSQGQLVSIVTPEVGVNLDWLCDSKLGSITVGDESLTYTYDGPLLTSEAASGTLTATVELGYDANLRVGSLSYAGASEAITYDADNLVAQMGRNAITHDAASGLPVRVSDLLAGGTYVQGRTINGFGELSDWTDSVSGVVRSAVSLQRNKAGQITHRTVTVDGGAVHYVYTYDDLGRLTGVSKDGVPVESYGYGAGGWRTSEHLGRSYDYSPGDRLLTAGGVTYTCDPDGFLATRSEAGQTTAYTYTARGELVRAALPDGRVVEYVYDPQGRRIAKKIDEAVVQKYQWLGQTTLLAVYDGSGTLQWRFEYADGRMPVSAVDGAGQRRYLLFDQVGTPLAVTDPAGTILKRLDHDSFGRRLADSNPALSIPFGFAGGLYDADTGLIRFGARDYDPETGRWTALDPIGFAGGDSDLYGYCVSDPVNWVDSQGHFPAAVGIGIEIGLLAGGPGGALVGGIFGAIIGSYVGWQIAQEFVDDAEIPNSPECKAEWQEARKICREELAKPCPSKGLTGGHKTVDGCAKGLVSHHCGGNAVH